MNDYFKLSVEDKRRVLQQTSARLGLPPQAIEKDLWVTTILQIVFTLSMIFGEKPTFRELLAKMKMLENLFHES